MMRVHMLDLVGVNGGNFIYFNDLKQVWIALGGDYCVFRIAGCILENNS